MLSKIWNFMTSTFSGRVTRSRTSATVIESVAAVAAAVPRYRGKRKTVDSSVTDTAAAAESNKKKKTKQSNMNSSTTDTGSQEEEGEVDVEMKDAAESSSTASSTSATMLPAYSSMKDKEAINALLRQPLPNVLADMVTDYLFHPLFDLWEEIVFTYESLPQMPKEDKEKVATSTASHITAHKKKQQTSQNEQIELMPKLQLSPPASPMEVDELEQQFRVKYDDPNFHFSPELKFLWSIADGLECPQNMIFRGRFWPSLTTMRAILECPENSYYVMYHYHAQHNGAWLKYDFCSNTFYATASYEDQDHLFEENMMVIVFHSITHFMKALLATLKLAAVSGGTYRVPRDRWWWREIPGDPHPPAIEVDHTRGFVPQPEVDLPMEWEFLLLGDCGIPDIDDQLIPGHLTSVEYLSIRKSICAHENKWAERLLNMTHDERWVKRVKHPQAKSSDNGGLNDAVDEDDEEDIYDRYSNRDYRGFPVIADCHLLDAMDGYAN